MSWILTAVGEMSLILLKVMEVSGKKSYQGKVAKNCLFEVVCLRPYMDLVLYMLIMLLSSSSYVIF